jgi:hypothetical protein
MAVRGEEVATSIEAHVRESIDRMVSEIRSSIEDVREVVNSQLKAALQSVQADVNSITFLPHIQKSIGELEESLKPEPVEAPTIVPQTFPAGGPDASRVKSAVQAVERGKSQVDVLNALLEESLQFGSRAALLILRGETFSGWKGVGFTAAGGNDENIKRFNAAPGLIPELDTVLRDEHVVIWDGANISTRLGVPASTRAILVPMVIKDKVAAAVYIDAVEADIAKLDAPSVELLVFATGLLIDTLALRKKTPSPSLIEGGSTAAGLEPEPVAPAPRPAPAAPPPAPPRPAPQAAPPPAPAPVPPPRPAAPPPPSEPQRTETMRFDAAQIKELMAGAASPAPKFNIPSAEEFSSPTPPPRPAPAPAPPPAAPPASTSMGEEGGARPSTQYVPPSGVGRGTAFQTPQSEDAKKHDEARRFARLLVSEIKLYNESKVDQGRKNRDLYERLKEDIDRSRQMYDDRIADEVRKTSNYFYDELVRILADGHAESLGL